MLARCYKAELSKLLKSRGIIIALVAVLVMVVFLGIFASVFEGIGLGDIDPMQSMFAQIKDIPREEYKNKIAELESKLEFLEGENSTQWSRFMDARGYMITEISIFKYLDAHPDVDAGKLDVGSTNMFALADSSYDFMLVSVIIISQIAIFYGVIMMSNLLSQEYKEGTLKMQLLRPNTRNTLLTAKWLAVFTLSSIVFIIGVIACSLFAGFKFKFETRDLVCVIANTEVFLLNSNVFILLQILLSFVSIFAMIQFSAFMCTILKFNRAASMAVPIIILLFGNFSAYLLQVVYLGMFDFANNLNLITFLIPGAQSMSYVSLYTAVPILGAYIALFMSLEYIKFNKLEI